MAMAKITLRYREYLRFIGSNPITRSKYRVGRSSVGRALDCDSGRRGFESHRSPHFVGLFYENC